MIKLNKVLKATVVFGVATALVFSCQTQMEKVGPEVFSETSNLVTGTPIAGQYIVVYRSGAMSAARVSRDYSSRQEFMALKTVDFLQGHNIQKEAILNVYGNVLEGFTAKLDAEMLEKIKADPRVKFVEQDKIIALAPGGGKGKPGGGGSGGTPPPQETPWGISRVNGGADGSGKTAWVIDSGIDLDHPDLNVDIARSVSYVRGDANDQNGHGTHVAGTIAALDNNEGVIGVAAGATVVAVRVLDRRGSGSTSGVIGGVDYVGANGSAGDVANMSLGGGVSSTLDQAVIDASNASGVMFCLAAGNESDDANNHSPARANGPNIVTISASDSNDNFASFSNYGSPVDWCAPGVSIKSTWKGAGYNTISGTSMATPHAAGVLLLGTGRNGGTVNGDPDGNPDTIITH